MESDMTKPTNEIHELSTDELDAVAGGRLALTTGSIIICGYGIEWNNRSISFVTPTGDTIVNRPR
jgi:hypothetical protein